jgi:DNA processing protein
MSGLSLATVVVQASVTSGARMQARVALQHGRTVFLLKSLVEEHDWARQYVEEGVYGTTALMISSSSELVDRLELREPEPELVTA